MADQPLERWVDGSRYEHYMGRWSRRVATEFLAWLDVPDGRRWLDVGCGTGALSQAIVDCCKPAFLLGIDPAAGFVEHASRQLGSEHVQFRVATTATLAHDTAPFDSIVSGLALNFMPEPEVALTEMMQVAVPGGLVALYIWDYGDKMESMRYFWDAAIAASPEALSKDEGRRFPFCRQEPLRQLLLRAGLHNVEVRAIEITAHYASFDEYWFPFLDGWPFPAPAYYATRPQSERDAMRAHLLQRLPIREDGSFDLTLRAWAARGTT